MAWHYELIGANVVVTLITRNHVICKTHAVLTIVELQLKLLTHSNSVVSTVLLARNNLSQCFAITNVFRYAIEFCMYVTIKGFWAHGRDAGVSNRLLEDATHTWADWAA